MTDIVSLERDRVQANKAFYTRANLENVLGKNPGQKGAETLSKIEKVLMRYTQNAKIDPETLLRSEKVYQHGENKKDLQQINDMIDHAGFWERWKWLSGVTNAIDNTMLSLYNEKIKFLENREVDTKEQMNNVLRSFAGTNLHLQEYARVRNARMEKIKGSTVWNVVKKFFALFYSSADKMVNWVEELRTTSSPSSAGRIRVEAMRGSALWVKLYHSDHGGRFVELNSNLFSNIIYPQRKTELE